MTQVHEVLSAISEASAALNREPELQRKLADYDSKLNQAYMHSQNLEVAIGDYKAYIKELESKVRSLEVERDEMGFRELEAQDKLDSLRSFVRNTMAQAAELLPKSVEIDETKPVTMEEMKEAASTASGSSSLIQGTNPQTVITNEVGSSAPIPTYVQPQVSGAPMAATTLEPMAAPLPGQSESPLLSAPTTESQSTSAPLTAESTGIALSNKPYEGKTYTEIMRDGMPFIPHEDWLNGGGTEEDYWK